MVNMSAADFVALAPLEENSPLIIEKEFEIRRATLGDHIRSAPMPEALTVPTEAAVFGNLLRQNIEGISAEAYALLRAHVQAHHYGQRSGSVTHETWLESGMSFNTNDDCPFCGQHLNDKRLIQTYQGYFSAAYKALSEEIKSKRLTLGRYLAGDFRANISAKVHSNAATFTNWQTLVGIDVPQLPDLSPKIAEFEELAQQIDRIFETKQSDIISAIESEEVGSLLVRWDACRRSILEYNQALSAYVTAVNQIKSAQDRHNLTQLKADLSLLKAQQQRGTAPVLTDISGRQALLDRQGELTREKAAKKHLLTEHSNAVSSDLGATINAYLKRLGAGFKINYLPPNYRGSEPAADYSILINEVPIAAKANEDVSKPTFKNTLSTGDKSVLALSIFLATLQAEGGLSEKIIVLDDPFTSMDEFRRTFTVSEINKLSDTAKQVIVLSHKKSFLRLIWDRVEHTKITSLAVQTGAPGVASLVQFSIEEATLPRQETERNKVLRFVDATEGNPAEIRRLLRIVLEHFYRKGDRELFGDRDTLDEIIRKIRSQDDAYRYKSALTELEEINFYTRNFHHAPVNGSVSEDTNVEELKTYCERVRDLTRGAL